MKQNDSQAPSSKDSLEAIDEIFSFREEFDREVLKLVSEGFRDHPGVLLLILMNYFSSGKEERMQIAEALRTYSVEDRAAVLSVWAVAVEHPECLKPEFLKQSSNTESTENIVELQINDFRTRFRAVLNAVERGDAHIVAISTKIKAMLTSFDEKRHSNVVAIKRMEFSKAIEGYILEAAEGKTIHIRDGRKRTGGVVLTPYVQSADEPKSKKGS